MYMNWLMFLVDLVIGRQSHAQQTQAKGERKWFVHWYSSLYTGIPVIDPEFDPGHKSVLSHSFFLFQPVLVEHLTVYIHVCTQTVFIHVYLTRVPTGVAYAPAC